MGSVGEAVAGRSLEGEKSQFNEESSVTKEDKEVRNKAVPQNEGLKCEENVGRKREEIKGEEKKMERKEIECDSKERSEMFRLEKNWTNL